MLCPLCSSSKNKSVYFSNNQHGHYQLTHQKILTKQCLKCTCVFPNIKVNSKYYQKYYPSNYQKSPSYLENFWIKKNLHQKVNLVSGFKSILDVGCGQADFLNFLPKNISAVGIDLNPNNRKDLNIIKDDFLKHKFTQKFDCITFFHSLEHFSNPQKVINKSLQLLNKHGHIFIIIPNTNSFAYKISQKYWFHLDSPRHLFLPNNQNIKLLFPKNSKIKINYLPWEFPLDLYWSLHQKPYLRIFYPILKFFDRETMLISLEI